LGRHKLQPGAVICIAGVGCNYRSVVGCLPPDHNAGAAFTVIFFTGFLRKGDKRGEEQKE